LAKDNHRDAGDLDDTGEGSHAADEPTAVWDADALRKAGLAELLDAPDSPVSGPATPAMGFEVERPSIIVEDEDQAGARQVRTPAPGRPGTKLGWLSLVATALVLGGIAYAVIRLLR
jgi:hypothetical protein